MKTDRISDAVACLNIFRSHRGEEALSPSIAQNALDKEIKFEYLRELRGEGQIYFLHKRNYQRFGLYSSGVYEFDGSGRCSFTDSPSIATRYNVPIPSGENY